MRNFTFLLLLVIPFFSFAQIISSIDVVGGIDSKYRGFSHSDYPYIPELQIGNQKKLNWNTGLNYNTTLREKLILKTGIRFASYGYKHEENDLRWGSEFENGEYTPDPTLPHKLKFVSSDWFIEIPIAGRYVFKEARISPFAEVGLAPSVYLRTNTKQTTEFSTKTSSYDAVDNFGINRIHILGLVSIGANYNLTPIIQLFAQPIFRYHLTKLADGPGAERLYCAGIEIGLRKGFNRIPNSGIFKKHNRQYQ
jgi:hypothetical protein